MKQFGTILNEIFNTFPLIADIRQHQLLGIAPVFVVVVNVVYGNKDLIKWLQLETTTNEPKGAQNPSNTHTQDTATDP